MNPSARMVLLLLLVLGCQISTGFPGLISYIPQDAFVDARERFGLDERLRQEFLQADLPTDINMRGGCRDKWTINPNKPELKAK